MKRVLYIRKNFIYQISHSLINLRLNYENNRIVPYNQIYFSDKFIYFLIIYNYYSEYIRTKLN